MGLGWDMSGMGPGQLCTLRPGTTYSKREIWHCGQFGTGQYAMHWQKLLTVAQNSLQVPTDVRGHQNRYIQILIIHTYVEISHSAIILPNCQKS